VKVLGSTNMSGGWLLAEAIANV